MREQRMKFARRFKDWGVQDWSKVMWSDESYFRVLEDRRRYVRRPADVNRFLPRYTCPNVKHPDAMMIWGSFSGAAGAAGLKCMRKGVTMNSERYIEVLEEQMLPNWENHGCELFMHDGASCHRAKIVKAWFNAKGISTMEWPGNSPDLNPIENVWNYMKDKVCSASNTNTNELCVAIQRVWDEEMTMDYFKKLSDSMPDRIKAVITAHGYPTKY